MFELTLMAISEQQARPAFRYAFATDLALIPRSLEIPSAANASRAGSVDHAGKNGARRIGTKLNGHHSIAIRPGVSGKQPFQTLTRIAGTNASLFGFYEFVFLLVRDRSAPRRSAHGSRKNRNCARRSPLQVFRIWQSSYAATLETLTL